MTFLRALDTPVFSQALVEEFMTALGHANTVRRGAVSNEDRLRLANITLQRLSLSHFNVLFYITSFLKEVLMHSADNNLTAQELARLFAACLMQIDPNASARARPLFNQATALLMFFFKADSSLFQIKPEQPKKAATKPKRVIKLPQNGRRPKQQQQQQSVQEKKEEERSIGSLF
jgi:hypothetical protein